MCLSWIIFDEQTMIYKVILSSQIKNLIPSHKHNFQQLLITILTFSFYGQNSILESCGHQRLHLDLHC